MSDIAIKVEHLGKKYRIGGQQATYGSLRESLVNAIGAPLRWLKGERSPAYNDFWALDDISFEVKRGDVVGIIGRNGAGKSTLLKILSHITKPTRGRVELNGRVASLLEVGTGFHPELTGRENIFLNGAILGMSRFEITRKFDEIVDFAEVEKFLDTPVKFYSSGMYVRLAFAVAAHLEPEILVVDEVLSVGDMQFQKKSLGKMGEVSRQGRTILFVSHNMGAVMNLCNHGLLLTNGKVTKYGTISEVVDCYLDQSVHLSGEQVIDANVPGASSENFLFSQVQILDSKNQFSNQIPLGEDIYIQIEFIIKNPIRGANVAFHLWNHSGICVLTSTDVDNDPDRILITREPGKYVAKCKIPALFFRSGIYTVSISASIPNTTVLADLSNAINFSVIDLSSVESKIAQGRQGVIAPIITWNTKKG